ncbi:Exodeoxyribonuclease [Piscirickettsia salmonis]|uniref:Exodeoxyribonuclease III n=1 Tax=Piscirickettsia salmonis TaxID=1238 RepID=A0A1L6TF63_PISSA|nr:exodeoxyribonuclease III [Piscirickettsia salmonis]AKP72402.1 DNA-(apurinic or apyrimidinic site) lyase [Piscirickettsia salmonis LF-89 = ATCC VR-1361]ALB24141.1 exodeoxyribonuclease III [Piscirickettsia salmonis]ALY03948.1 DNA-(apurinic or apyrimidinic site) lyase [Piscirickettsia salmonis]AMA43509.1 DNA-(apurinic or apyrimidinic site) lyase [Piscirickettsia salmonis]AOS35978.1 DNA-(apurinic or apyrimidinic site) lyase [Piscirickettsia salmonis]
MRVISANLNGIRAAARKGFFDWLNQINADVICIQETKAQEHQLEDEIFNPPGYYRYLFDAEKKGYSGVAIYSKKKPDRVHTGLGFEIADTEGRYIQADFGKLSIASLYLPSGSSSVERHERKWQFMHYFMEILKGYRSDGREYIICGDWNTIHQEIDIKNFKSNQKTSGCTPAERAWMDDIINDVGFVDAFRLVNSHSDQYTWWSNRGQAWAKNVGWRIDYQLITPGLKDQIVGESIYKEERFSDHAPLIIDYKDLTGLI